LYGASWNYDGEVPACAILGNSSAVIFRSPVNGASDVFDFPFGVGRKNASTADANRHFHAGLARDDNGASFIAVISNHSSFVARGLINVNGGIQDTYSTNATRNMQSIAVNRPLTAILVMHQDTAENPTRAKSLDRGLTWAETILGLSELQFFLPNVLSPDDHYVCYHSAAGEAAINAVTQRQISDDTIVQTYFTMAPAMAGGGVAGFIAAGYGGFGAL
jgi:hypothetical protein